MRRRVVLSFWLYPLSFAEGSAGQVYGITDLEGGGFAVAVGWSRDGRSQNAILPTIATYVAGDGSAIVVRTGLVDGAPRSVAAVYRDDGEVIGTWKSKHPWNAVIRSGSELRGIVIREGTILEKADFPDVR